MSDSRVSVAKAAKIAGRSPETVRRAIRSGELEARRFGPRGWYSVSTADVQALIFKSCPDGADAAGDAAGGNQDEIFKAS
jgi:hypothetical protein